MEGYESEIGFQEATPAAPSTDSTLNQLVPDFAMDPMVHSVLRPDVLSLDRPLNAFPCSSRHSFRHRLIHHRICNHDKNDRSGQPPPANTRISRLGRVDRGSCVRLKVGFLGIQATFGRNRGNRFRCFPMHDKGYNA
jgi:hypothetical protein